MRNRKVSHMLTIAVALVAGSSRAGTTGVSTYGIDSYAPCANDLDGVADAQGFRDGLLNAPNTIWTAGLVRTNNQITVTNFTDSSRVAGGGDSNTTSGFDRGGDAFAYYAGHGANGPGSSGGCNVSADCTSPPGGQSMPAVCAHYPPNSWTIPTGWTPNCRYSWKHQMVLGAATHCASVPFSNSDTNKVMALGEAPSVTWGGVGSDGGVNVAIFDMSHPVYPGLETKDADVFQGLMMLLTVSAFGHGDTVSDGNRGAYFAYSYGAYGASSTVEDGWFLAEYLLTVGATSGGCDSLPAGGGWKGSGISGCGGHTAISMGATQSEADGLRTSSWALVTQSSRKPTGATFKSVNRMCNYDCATYPPYLPLHDSGI